jgi:hypothetical protein
VLRCCPLLIRRPLEATPGFDVVHHTPGRIAPMSGLTINRVPSYSVAFDRLSAQHRRRLGRDVTSKRLEELDGQLLQSWIETKRLDELIRTVLASCQRPVRDAARSGEGNNRKRSACSRREAP